MNMGKRVGDIVVLEKNLDHGRFKIGVGNFLNPPLIWRRTSFYLSYF